MVEGNTTRYPMKKVGSAADAHLSDSMRGKTESFPSALNSSLSKRNRNSSNAAGIAGGNLTAVLPRITAIGGGGGETGSQRTAAWAVQADDRGVGGDEAKIGVGTTIPSTKASGHRNSAFRMVEGSRSVDEGLRRLSKLDLAKRGSIISTLSAPFPGVSSTKTRPRRTFLLYFLGLLGLSGLAGLIAWIYSGDYVLLLVLGGLGCMGFFGRLALAHEDIMTSKGASADIFTRHGEHFGTRFLPMFRFNSRVIRSWHIILIVCTLWTFFWIPLSFAFDAKRTRGYYDEIYRFDFFIDWIFFAVPFIRMRTSVCDVAHGKEWLGPMSKIFHMALRDKTFYLDLLSNVPTVCIFVNPESMTGYGPNVRWAPPLKLLRGYRLLFIPSSHLEAEYNISVHLSRIFVWVIVVTHMMACYWFWIATIAGSLAYHFEFNHMPLTEFGCELNSQGSKYLTKINGYYPGATMDEGCLPENIAEKYTVTSLYSFAFREGSYVFLGRVRPAFCHTEMMLFGLWGPVGGLLLAYISAQTTVLLQRIDAVARKHHEHMTFIRGAMKSLRLPKDLTERIESYHHFLAIHHDLNSYSSIFQGLSMQLFTELKSHIYNGLFENAPFFQNATSEFINYIVLALEEITCCPADLIVTQGEIGHEMYWILRGRCEVVESLRVVAHLQENQFFGEIALLADTPRLCTVRATTYCLLAMISRERFLPIIEEFPEQKEFMVRRLQGYKMSNGTEEVSSVRSSLANSKRESLAAGYEDAQKNTRPISPDSSRKSSKSNPKSKHGKHADALPEVDKTVVDASSVTEQQGDTNVPKGDDDVSKCAPKVNHNKRKMSQSSISSTMSHNLLGNSVAARRTVGGGAYNNRHTAVHLRGGSMRVSKCAGGTFGDKRQSILEATIENEVRRLEIEALQERSVFTNIRCLSPTVEEGDGKSGNAAAGRHTAMHSLNAAVRHSAHPVQAVQRTTLTGMGITALGHLLHRQTHYDDNVGTRGGISFPPDKQRMSMSTYKRLSNLLIPPITVFPARRRTSLSGKCDLSSRSDLTTASCGSTACVPKTIGTREKNNYNLLRDIKDRLETLESTTDEISMRLDGLETTVSDGFERLTALLNECMGKKFTFTSNFLERESARLNQVFEEPSSPDANNSGPEPDSLSFHSGLFSSTVQESPNEDDDDGYDDQLEELYQGRTSSVDLDMERMEDLLRMDLLSQEEEERKRMTIDATSSGGLFVNLLP